MKICFLPMTHDTELRDSVIQYLCCRVFCKLPGWDIKQWYLELSEPILVKRNGTYSVCMCVRVCVRACHNFLLSFNKFRTLLMCTGWVTIRRSDACVLKVFSLCLYVPSLNWLKHGKLSIFECLDNSELFIENVCMYNVSFFFPLSMYFF